MARLAIAERCYLILKAQCLITIAFQPNARSNPPLRVIFERLGRLWALATLTRNRASLPVLARMLNCAATASATNSQTEPTTAAAALNISFTEPVQPDS